MKTSDDAYAEFVADIILSYFTAQQAAGIEGHHLRHDSRRDDLFHRPARSAAVCEKIHEELPDRECSRRVSSRQSGL